jgi:hypothetical protein
MRKIRSEKAQDSSSKNAVVRRTVCDPENSPRLGLLLAFGSGPTLTPGEEARGTEGEPAERTFVGCLLVERALLRNHFVTRHLASSDGLTGVGVSVVY